MNTSFSNIGRVPFLLTSQSALSNINRTNVSAFNINNQLSTGRRINRASDDSVRASAISVLDGRLAVSDQRERSLAHASTVLGSLDNSMKEASDLVRDAQSLASSQIGLTSSATERTQQANVVSSMIRQLYSLTNRTHDGSPQGVHLFGGSATNTPPVVEVNGGYRYVGRGSGMLTDLGLPDEIPITVGGQNALGEISARVTSTVNLDPNLAAGTRLTDLNGARGLGISPGVINFTFSGSPVVGTVDLTQTQSVQETATKLEAAIRAYETANGVSVLGPGGVSFNGERFSFAVVAAGAPTLSFSDATNGTTAADLGLVSAPFSNAAQNGVDLDPKLTLRTPIASLTGVTVPLGSIRIRTTQGGVAAIHDIDLSSAQTLDDMRNLLETSGSGVRLEINQAGTGINLLNEVAGVSIAVEEVPGGANTATELGIRSYAATTAISDFNNGRGVRIVSGAINPVTGLPDPTLDADFRITLGNGQYFDVDLQPADLVNVQTVLTKVNAAFTAAIGSQNNPAAPVLAAGQFTAGLTNGINGLSFSSPVAGAIAVGTLNNSAAAEDLGLLGLSLDATSATYVAQDRAQVRVNNLFSDLVDLRDALLRNDSSAITLAGEQMNANADRMYGAYALVGTYDKRIREAQTQLEDLRVLDTKTKSELQDVDFAEAATRFSQLQTQLQASLRTASIMGSTSLFDLIG